jgi:hypothetical protein
MTIFTHILFASLFITSISLFVYYKRKFLRLKTDFEKQRAVIVDAVDKMWLDCATALLLSYQSDVEKLSPIFKDAAPSVGYLQYTVNSYQSMGWVCGHWFKKTVVDPITDNIHVTLVNSHKTPSTIGSVSLCLYFTNGELQQIGIANWFPRNISYRFDQGPG